MKDEKIVFCKGGGCTAKLGPQVLERVLSRLPKQKKDEHLLVGYDSSDDAAVYQISENKAIVQTLDFFPPMVEDPYIFGQIAATNALSDIYAMGGRPVTALNIVCFPQSWDLNILGEIMRGGAEKVAEAGATLCGGHSIQDQDIKYGLSVTGIIDPEKVLKNNGCQEQDMLLLTKPLGVGIICTAQRVGSCDAEAYHKAIQSMTTLNRYAAEVLNGYPIHACTDVTGFGLVCHLLEMLTERFGAVVYTEQLPCIELAEHYAEEFYITAAGQRNRNHAGNRVDFDQVSFGMEEIVFDPQTSGGLLVSVAEKDAKEIMEKLKSVGCDCRMIGRVLTERELEELRRNRKKETLQVLVKA